MSGERVLRPFANVKDALRDAGRWRPLESRHKRVATDCSAFPTRRASGSERTRPTMSATAMAKTKPITESQMTAGGRLAREDHADRGDHRQDERRHRLEERSEDDPSRCRVGGDRPLAIEDEPRGDVGGAGDRADDGAGREIRSDARGQLRAGIRIRIGAAFAT